MKKITVLIFIISLLSSFRIHANEGVTVVADLSPEKPTVADWLTEYATDHGDYVTYSGVSKLIVKGEMSSDDFTTIKAMDGIQSVDLWETNRTSLPTLAFSESTGLYMEGILTLEEVRLPKNLKIIGNFCFSGSPKLKKMNLKECPLIEELGQEALFGTAIEEFYFGKNLKSIDGTSLGNNLSAKSITIDPENPYFVTEQNALYLRESNQLIYYPFACEQKKLVVREGTVSIGWEVFRKQAFIEEIVLPNTLKTIEEAAFPECSNLKKINLPESVLSIGINAFDRTGLESITIPSAVKLIEGGTFRECKNLREVTVKGPIKSIGSWAFDGCYNLEKLIIEDASQIEQILSYCFRGCSKIKSFDFSTSSNLTNLDAYSFQNCKILETVSLPNSVDSIGNYAFDGCEALKNFKFPTDLIKIFDYVFRNNKSLTHIDIGEKLEVIGTGAFSYCTAVSELNVAKNNYFVKLDNNILVNSDGSRIIFVPASGGIADLTIDDGIDTIDDYAFSGNQVIEKVKFSGDIKRIGNGAFSGCKNLKSINLTKCALLETIGDDAFGDCSKLNQIKWMSDKDEATLAIGNKVFINCTSLTEIRLPSQTKTLKDYIFQGCTSLETADLSNLKTVTRIGNLFLDCSSLNKVNLPQGGKLTSLGYYIFNGCSSLKTITIPATMTGAGSVNGEMFDGSGLEEFLVETGHPKFISKNGSLQSIDGKVFYACPTAKSGSFTIPDGIEQIYSNAFYAVTGITNITLPKTIKPFGYNNVDGSFKKMYGLESFTLTEDHPNYSVENGILYSKDFKNLYFYPSNINREFVLNDKVEVLEGGSVIDNPHLTSIVLPAPVKIVENYPFSNLENLQKLELPETVTEASSVAEKCPKLIEVILHATTIPRATKYVFDGCHEDLIVHVPFESLESYQANKYWKNFNLAAIEADAIEEMTADKASNLRLRIENGILHLSSNDMIAWAEIYSLDGSLLNKSNQSVIDLSAFENQLLLLVVRFTNGDVASQKIIIR